MLHGDFEWGVIANLNCAIIFCLCMRTVCFTTFSRSVVGIELTLELLVKKKIGFKHLEEKK